VSDHHEYTVTVSFPMALPVPMPDEARQWFAEQMYSAIEARGAFLFLEGTEVEVKIARTKGPHV
jgi:hypothetical protein